MKTNKVGSDGHQKFRSQNFGDLFVQKFLLFGEIFGQHKTERPSWDHHMGF